MTDQRKSLLQLSALHFAAALLALLVLLAAETVIATGVSVAALPVSPVFAVDNLFDCRLADTVLVGQHFSSDNVRHITGANLFDLFKSQNSGLTVFASHINGITQDTACKKMVRPNAGRIVAHMTADEAIRHSAISQLVSNTVCSSVALPFPNAELPVATFRVGAAKPQPTGVIFSFLNLAPKSQFYRDMIPSNAALNRAVLDDPIANSPRFGIEGATTVLTDAIWLANSITSHFKSPIFDTVRDTETLQRLGISLEAKPSYYELNNLAQNSCTLAPQGYTNSCDGPRILWFTRTLQSNIEKFRLITYYGNYDVPATARAFTIPSGCSSGGSVTIQEIQKNSQVCQVSYSGNLPHSRPCDQCGGISSGVSIVSAANFRGAVSRGALVSAFPDPGVTFTDRQEIAGLLPLPTMMGGISVEVDGQLCGLSAVAPGQINFVLPENLPAGPQEVSVIINSTRGTSPRFFGRAQINPNAPGLFTINAAGTGTASAVWLVATQSGQVFYFNAGSLPPLNPTDRAFLIVYGTGIHEPQAELWLTNGRRYDALHSVATIFPGLWQLAFPVPVGELWQGQMSGFVRVFNSAGYWDSQGVDFRR